MIINIKDPNLKELIESFTKEFEENNLYYLTMNFLKKFKWFKKNFEEDYFYYFSPKKIYRLKIDEKNLLSFISDNQQNNNKDIEIEYEYWTQSFFSLSFEKTKNIKLKYFLFHQYKENNKLFEDCEVILNDIKKSNILF